MLLCDFLPHRFTPMNPQNSAAANQGMLATPKFHPPLSVSADTLVFDENECGPNDDLRLQFEATTRPSDEEKRVVKTVIESIILNHEAKRWAP
jgi:hypothetical protein